MQRVSVNQRLEEVRKKETQVEYFQKIYEEENALIKLVFTEKCGRYTTASRDINAGEVVHQALPYCSVSDNGMLTMKHRHRWKISN